MKRIIFQWIAVGLAECIRTFADPALRALVAGGARLTAAVAGLGLGWTMLQGLVIVRRGPRILQDLFAGTAAEQGQIGFGAGAAVTLLGLLFVLTPARLPSRARSALAQAPP